MTRQLQLFLTYQDEAELSRLLRNEFPGIIFLNDNVWPHSVDCRDGIEQCDTGRVYLHIGEPTALPTMRRKDGSLEGPVAGCVIQILRSKKEDGVLLSGRIAAGIDDADEKMRDFVLRTWKCVKKLGEIGVLRPDGRIDKHYLVGRFTSEAIATGTLKIADRAVRMHYELVARGESVQKLREPESKGPSLRTGKLDGGHSAS
jgi:hypothetical protein